jgi:Spy/CpxP family protein refolding chaperone
MRSGLILALPFLALTINPPTYAAPQDHTGHHSAYSGQQHRAIKSLSEKDIEELRRGGGWGLAKAAELNGMPGPAHLLELKDKIDLTQGQAAAITALFERMREQAITKGEQLIELEKRLDHAFKSRHITNDRLDALLSDISRTRKELRFIHLSTHLETPKILTAEQIRKYNILRGYN